MYKIYIIIDLSITSVDCLVYPDADAQATPAVKPCHSLMLLLAAWQQLLQCCCHMLQCCCHQPCVAVLLQFPVSVTISAM